MTEEQIFPSWDCSEIPQLTGMQALIAGVDEVGRGALFGPVVAAAAVVPISGLPELVAIGVKDSKQLGAKKRSKLVQPIQGTVKSWALGYATVEEIDRLNILQASLLAMKRAVLKLRVQPEMCLVDGKQPIPELPLSQKNLVKGDRRSPIIAAASILAKVWRDELIIRLAGKYPHYDLASNKGYGTKRHLLALQQYGPSPQHRMSFRSCRVD